ncbi:MAG: phosphatidate cytidylyltransferase [Clostridiales bacterium]|nr:phosphatidate cytidylyltransferase [Clostridiales bacterium]
MKELSNNATRLITSAVGVAIIIPCFIFMNAAKGLPLTILVSLISLLAVYEVIKAVGCKNNVIIVLSTVTAAAIPFLFNFDISVPFMETAVIYSIVYFILMVTMHKKTTFSDTVTALFATAAIPCAISTLIEFRDLYIDYPDKYDKAAGVFFILFGMFSAWITDAFAYIVGRRIGKHKLCPEISPKKSVEGAVGGVLGAAVFNLILFFVFDYFFFTTHSIKWWEIAIISVILSIISMFGDLSASIIKRNHGIKDFGKILPGHGGVMDRFDSCLFVLPSLYAAVFFLNF